MQSNQRLKCNENKQKGKIEIEIVGQSKAGHFYESATLCSAVTKNILTHPKSFQLSCGYFKKLILTGKNYKYGTTTAKLY